MLIETLGIKTIVFDFSRVLLFAKDPGYSGDLNPLHRRLLEESPDYPFLDYFYLNQELLDYLKTLSRVRLIIFTSGFIQEAPAIQPAINRVFESILSAEKMGVRKTEPEAYIRLCKAMHLQPSEILFIDDAQRNLDAARDAGLRTLLFTNTSQLFAHLEKLVWYD